MKKLLVLVTNHATLGETDEANGTFAPELTHALHEVEEAEIDYDIVSIAGGEAPLYGTDDEDDTITQNMLGREEFMHRIKHTKAIHDIDAGEYRAVFYPGGFGLLSDLADNEAAADVSASVYEAGGVIAAVCHGPAGLLPIKLGSGDHLLATKSVTGFTREEEVDFGTIGKIPYLLEEKLARNAAQYSKKQPWQEFVVEDGRLITGQNPASAGAVGRALVKQLQ